jgi:hypothetical protein
MKYILTERGTFRPVRKLIKVAEDKDLGKVFAHLLLMGYNPRVVSKPPSKRTARRWRQGGRARAICGCWVHSTFGRCAKHGKMSWLAGLIGLKY